MKIEEFNQYFECFEQHSKDLWIEVPQNKFNNRDRPTLPRIGIVVSPAYRTGGKGRKGIPDYNWYCDCKFIHHENLLNGRAKAALLASRPERTQVNRLQLLTTNTEEDIAS